MKHIRWSLVSRFCRIITYPLYALSVTNANVATSRFNDRRLENGISLIVRGNYLRQFRCWVNYKFIRSILACLPIHRAILNGNTAHLFFFQFVVRVGHCSMILNDSIRLALNFTPFTAPLRGGFDFPQQRRIWKSRNTHRFNKFSIAA